MDYVLLALLSVISGCVLTVVVLNRWAMALRSESVRQHQAAAQLARESESLVQDKRALQVDQSTLAGQQREFRSQKISYSELAEENRGLRAEVRNVQIYTNKCALDVEEQQRRQQQQAELSQSLGQRYLKDTTRWIASGLNANNLPASRERLTKAIAACREIGLHVSSSQESQLFGDLEREFHRVLRASLQREEQARIRAQIREEQLREREAKREQEQLEREQLQIREALERALAQTHDEHAAEVEALRAQLAEAEARTQRAVSQAQLTKAGFVYVISNLGAFGDEVFKVGMTRRLEPMDRVRELGDASVPFPFDVHMMISSEDAPALEIALHRGLHHHRVNKVNLRKEFFRCSLEAIRSIVETHHGTVEFVIDPEALEYRQSLTMTDEDQEFIESMYEECDDELAIDGRVADEG